MLQGARQVTGGGDHDRISRGLRTRERFVGKLVEHLKQQGCSRVAPDMPGPGRAVGPPDPDTDAIFLRDPERPRIAKAIGRTGLEGDRPALEAARLPEATGERAVDQYIAHIPCRDRAEELAARRGCITGNDRQGADDTAFREARIKHRQIGERDPDPAQNHRQRGPRELAGELKACAGALEPRRKARRPDPIEHRDGRHIERIA